ncbi:spore coat protein [Staphylospora marina]|uniref:spore coat protein n=1 Tax=Staphylospora marina TaxID=2490858 RepID=UPI000F5C103B|nr:spore coat protein [Staphylospora marina]
MRTQGQPENQTLNPNVSSPQLNHGAHEIHDVREVLTCAVNIADQYLMLISQAQDPELRDILTRQRQFMIQEYNTLVECFRTGQDPSTPTGSYEMKQGNNVEYGNGQMQSVAPAASPNEIDDRRISSQALGLMKSSALAKTKAACEVTNPVVRRVLADSAPNCVEMAYELFLYQNKRGYYPVQQLPQDQAIQLLNSFQPASDASVPGAPQTNHMQ